MSFALVTDSACSLPYTLCNSLNLTVLPLNYYIDDVEFLGFHKDRPVDLQHFYQSMRNGSKVRTSLPNLADTRNALVELLDQGKDILYLGFSCGLSGTFDSVHGICETLKADYPKQRLVCVETVAASFGEGLLVKKAALMKAAGATLDEIASWVEEHRMRAVHWVTVDDLSYVLGGGRLGHAGALAANLLHLKPILRIDEEGRVAIAGKARGRKKCLKAMVERMGQTVDDQTMEVYIGHGDCYDDAAFVEKLIKQELSPFYQVDIQYLDPIIGTHGGPGSLAIFFMGSGRQVQ